MDSSSMGSSDAATASLMFGVLGFFVILTYVVSAIFMGMMFKKAGVEAWKAWVPVYNVWAFLELGGQKGWISLLLLVSWIPFIGLIPAIIATVYTCIAAYKIGLSFGKEGWFVLLYIFVTIVWLIWLAVDKTAVWQPAPAQQLENAPSQDAPSQPMAM